MHMKRAALNSHSLSSGMYGGQTEETNDRTDYNQIGHRFTTGLVTDPSRSDRQQSSISTKIGAFSTKHKFGGCFPQTLRGHVVAALLQFGSGRRPSDRSMNVAPHRKVCPVHGKSSNSLVQCR